MVLAAVYTLPAVTYLEPPGSDGPFRAVHRPAHAPGLGLADDPRDHRLIGRSGEGSLGPAPTVVVELLGLGAREEAFGRD